MFSLPAWIVHVILYAHANLDFSLKNLRVIKWSGRYKDIQNLHMATKLFKDSNIHV